VTDFDLVVIGTGAAGSTAAYACREAGWSVAIADEKAFGGTCALRGCDPKKVFVAAEELVDWSRRFGAKSIVSGDIRIDWPALLRFKKTFVESVPQQNEDAYSEAGITALHGRIRFLERSVLQVGDDTLRARHVVIASGARPQILSISGEEHLTTSEGFLDLERLPARIIMVGGGYISFEFAHVAARAGATVTIVHKGSRPLERFDADLVGDLVDETRALGIDVRLNTSVRGIEKHDDVLRVTTTGSDGETTIIEADMAVHGAGRVPNIDDLDLEAGGVTRTKNGVCVNVYLQNPSNAAVYAAGDAADTGAPRLTPVAGMEGDVVAANLLGGNVRKPDASVVPSIVFTTPALGTVGLTEQNARERKVRFSVKRGDTTQWYSSRRVGAAKSRFKILIEDGSDHILGATVLGPGAEELMNLFAMAMKFRVPASQVRDTIFAYPSAASDLAYMV